MKTGFEGTKFSVVNFCLAERNSNQKFFGSMPVELINPWSVTLKNLKSCIFHGYTNMLPHLNPKPV